MSVWQKVRGSTANSFAIGNGRPGDKYLQADAGATNLPAIRYNDTSKEWEFANDGLTFSPFSSLAAHAALRQLIHLAIAADGPFESFTSGAYRETLPAGNPFPTSVIWWESSAKLRKITELAITYNANKTPATEVRKVYDASGTLLVTFTDTITYSGVFETSRTRTWV